MIGVNIQDKVYHLASTEYRFRGVGALVRLDRHSHADAFELLAYRKMMAVTLESSQ